MNRRHLESIEAKADRLIREGRCHEITCVPGKVWVGIVEGDTGRYMVTSVDWDLVRHLSAQAGPSAPQAACQCMAARTSGQCSHVLAAFRLRVRSESIDDVFASLA